MGKITVWTKQNKNILAVLAEKGRYVVKKEYIRAENEEHTAIILRAYDWLASHGPNVNRKPIDVKYPVWVSFDKARNYIAGKNEVLLTLQVDEADITSINLAKWGMILNYSYIPANEEDAQKHLAMMNAYGINDAEAVMTLFYPEIKQEIVQSWSRLFDPKVCVGNDLKYGNIWEIKNEWVINGI